MQVFSSLLIQKPCCQLSQRLRSIRTSCLSQGNVRGDDAQPPNRATTGSLPPSQRVALQPLPTPLPRTISPVTGGILRTVMSEALPAPGGGVVRNYVAVEQALLKFVIEGSKMVGGWVGRWMGVCVRAWVHVLGLGPASICTICDVVAPCMLLVHRMLHRHEVVPPHACSACTDLNAVLTTGVQKTICTSISLMWVKMG